MSYQRQCDQNSWRVLGGLVLLEFHKGVDLLKKDFQEQENLSSRHSQVDDLIVRISTSLAGVRLTVP